MAVPCSANRFLGEQALDKDKKYYNTSLSEEEWKSEQVSDDITNEKAGPESHQALYEKYFAP